MTNPDELRRQFGNHRGRTALFWSVLALLLAVAIAVPTAKPIWRTLKSWRADHFVRQAEELLGEQQLSLAFERARSALQLAPTRSDIIRLNARLLSLVGSEASLTLWQHLLRSGEATADDRASFVETALGFQRPDLVGNVVAQLGTGSELLDRDHRLKALYSLQTRDLVRARAHARDAHRAAPGNPTNTVLLASLLMDAGGDPARREACDLLWSVAQTNGPLQTGALEQLVGHPEATRQDRERVCLVLEALPARNAFQEALLAETQMQLDPRRANEIIVRLVAGLRRDDWQQLTAVVGVLLRQQRFSEILAVTTAGRSLANRSLFLARYEALLATEGPENAYRHLLLGDPPMSPFDLAIVRARAAQEIGDFKRRDSHLRDLLNLAGDHPLHVRRVAELAEAGTTRESFALATEAWKRLSAIPSEAIHALRSLQRLADRQGDTWTAREYARQSARRGDSDPDLPLQIIYYDLLLGDDLEEALADAQRYQQTHNDSFFLRAVLALAHLRLGSPAEARAVLDRFIVDQTRHEALTILAATYGANGLERRARELAGSLPLNRLRPEERELIRPWLVPPPAGLGTLPVL